MAARDRSHPHPLIASLPKEILLYVLAPMLSYADLTRFICAHRSHAVCKTEVRPMWQRLRLWYHDHINPEYTGDAVHKATWLYVMHERLFQCWPRLPEQVMQDELARWPRNKAGQLLDPLSRLDVQTGDEVQGPTDACLADGD